MKAAESLENSPRLATESRLGKYRLLATLGRGGMADIHLAMAEGLAGFSKLLVVKELRQESVEDDVGTQMFMDEARVAARLNHPNIVQTLEVGSEGSRCFLVMEYLEGQSLRRVVRRARARGAPLPLQTHLHIIVDVLSALEYAHSFTEFDGTPLSLVHRDVSPQNVIITYEGQVKLIDFGIAKTNLASGDTREGIVKGKVRYMPPEQATGRPVDARADVFAVGVMLWEALDGEGPWRGETDAKIFRSLFSGVVPRPSNANLEPYADLVAIVGRAVSADPQDRYPTASAMRDDIEASLGSSVAPPATSRGLRSLLSTLFEEDRRELRVLIDAQMGSPDRPFSLPMWTSETHVRTSSSGVRQFPAASNPVTAPKVHVSPIPPPLGGTTHRGKWRVALGAAAVALVVATGVVQSQRPAVHPSVPMALEPPSTAGSATLSPRETTAPSSHVEVRAWPPWARLSVDDVVVSNPYAADMARDGTTHRVHAEAPGYSAKTLPFVAGSEAELDLKLEREIGLGTKAQLTHASSPAGSPATTTAPSSVAETPPFASPHSVEDASPRRRTKREVDREDPYAQ